MGFYLAKLKLNQFSEILCWNMLGNVVGFEICKKNNHFLYFLKYCFEAFEELYLFKKSAKPFIYIMESMIHV